MKTKLTPNQLDALLSVGFDEDNHHNVDKEHHYWMPVNHPEPSKHEGAILRACLGLQKKGLCKVSGKRRNDVFEGPQFHVKLTAAGKKAFKEANQF